jgi:hypothetical protein
MSWLSNFLHPGRPYSAAEDQMRDYYNQAQGAYQPYIQQGQAAYGGLSSAMDALLNPEKLQAKWMESYETSPQAQQAMARAREQGLGAASAMGLMGSSAALKGIEGQAGQIASADRQQYLNDLMQKYMAGAGIGQNIYGTGASMTGQYGQNAMNMGNIMGGLEAARQQAGSGLLGNLLGAGANLGLNYLTGGFGVGGFGRGAWSPWGGS